MQSRIESISGSYRSIKDFDEVLQTTGRDYKNRDLVDEFLERPLDLKVYTANGPVNYEYTLDEVNEQILSSVFGVVNYNLTDFVETDELIYFIMENTERGRRSYLDALHEMSAVYGAKARAAKSTNQRLFKEFLVIVLCYVPAALALAFVLYLRIRSKKLIVMNFFLNIPSKSLEEIIRNGDDFVGELSSYEKQVEEVEKTEEEVVMQTLEYETGSCFSSSQQRYQKKYKKHRMSQKRVLEDNCTTISILVLKFLLLGAIVVGYFLIYYFVRRANNSQFYNAGYLADINNRVEIESLSLLVLIKESIRKDSNNDELSSIYQQMLTAIESSITLMEGLSDVMLCKQQVGALIQEGAQKADQQVREHDAGVALCGRRVRGHRCRAGTAQRLLLLPKTQQRALRSLPS